MTRWCLGQSLTTEHTGLGGWSDGGFQRVPTGQQQPEFVVFQTQRRFSPKAGAAPGPGRLPQTSSYSSESLELNIDVRPALSSSQAHPGFKVLLTASHYWPLEHVDGIRELQETAGAWRARNLTVPPSHNATFVPTNDSAYSNASATIDLVEGKVGKGIYLREQKGVTLLLYGRYKASCISNPAQCGPEEFSVAKLLPRALNSSHYRFPAQGHNYIEIPQEAFRSHGGIAEAAAYRSCPLSAASYLISLEVVPPPTLSQNLSGSPLTTVRLRHKLTSRQYREATNETNRVFLYCAFLDYSSVSTIRNQRYHIHANLSSAILVAQVLLLVSFHCRPGTVPCQVLAVLLHYFFLSAFAWMLVEGLHLYSLVVRVFGSEDSKLRYYYGVGWGSPLLICVVSISCALDSYGTTNKLTAKAVAVLLPILGTSWVFGVLAVNSQAVAFQYAFAILNSLQGFFIFLFHCLLNSEVRPPAPHSPRREAGKRVFVSFLKNMLTAKAVAVLLPILGTSWVFGVLAVNSQAVAFQYAFAILNSLQVRAAFKHKTKVWSLTSSSSRNANPKPFSSDVMNGTRPGTASSKLSPWDKSSQSAHGVDLSPV
ncbi:Putative G-protein coupled receptor 133 [Myotis brandtii]|uniref:Putative G-protein coupled receptor 133 n=1 Tax=Myotis brandtii TaxID=109478 RepID=S7N4U0_MYOBR|nr:Putative G-protein coupled receptor 133 [Myotis brandtii]